MKIALWPMKLALRGLPDIAHSHLLSHGFNHLLKGQRFGSRLKGLEGRRLWLTVTDAGCTCCFQIQDCCFIPDHLKDKPDIHISGTLNDFLLLATRKEDPDTLFFAQRLSLEGNTEDGLYLKNILDAMEFDTEEHFTSYLGEAAGIRMDRFFSKITSGRQFSGLVDIQDL